ncbi:MAG: ABC transporter permease [Chloroflexi bacterium]|nr:ABC transporter permease [Chloroflexota bacterium]MCI0725441.1 ABC transporter permease [Chloroflexota bacterium]
MAPISALETLLGKYLSYFIFISSLAAILTVLIVFVIRAPLAGEWWQYALVVATLIFTSLGLGFVLSLIAQTTSQAVQFSMILLLSSIFFTGFFLALDLLWTPVRVVSWLIPATYAIVLLQDIMLRGVFEGRDLLLSLAAFGLGFFVLAWILLRSRMAQR